MLLALSVSSRRLPGITLRDFAQRGGSTDPIRAQPIELQRVESFPGAA
jgi:hypothetical protein